MGGSAAKDGKAEMRAEESLTIFVRELNGCAPDQLKLRI